MAQNPGWNVQDSNMIASEIAWAQQGNQQTWSMPPAPPGQYPPPGQYAPSVPYAPSGPYGPSGPYAPSGPSGPYAPSGPSGPYAPSIPSGPTTPYGMFAQTGGCPTWVDARAGEIPPNAVPGGFDNEQLYVGRASHGGALIPGKVVPSHGMCYVPWGGTEHGKVDYQVLCGCEAVWVPSGGGAIPADALPSGETEDGEPLFVGRVQHQGTMTIGKVQESHNVCYIPYGGQEIAFPQYEVLVAK